MSYTERKTLPVNYIDHEYRLVGSGNNVSVQSYEVTRTKYIDVKVEVRVVYYENGRVRAKFSKEEYTFRKNPNDKLEIHEGVNKLKCHNCGASIDATKGECEYCHTEIKYLQEWIIDNK